MPGRASVSSNLGKAVLRGVNFGWVWFAEEKCRWSSSPRWVVYEFYFLLKIGSWTLPFDLLVSGTYIPRTLHTLTLGYLGGCSRVLLKFDSQVSYRLQNLFILPPVMEARSLQDVCFIHKLGLLFTVVEESGKREEGIWIGHQLNCFLCTRRPLEIHFNRLSGSPGVTFKNALAWQQQSYVVNLFWNTSLWRFCWIFWEPPTHSSSRIQVIHWDAQ